MSDLTFSCPSCGGLNRVPAERVAQAPRCGRCQAALDVSGHPVVVDDEGLARLIRSAPVPVLVDFWAPWCGPCRMVAPHLEALGKKHTGKLIIAKINVDDHKQTAGSLGIQSIPTLAVWSGGQLKLKEAGARTGPALEAFVAPYLR